MSDWVVTLSRNNGDVIAVRPPPKPPTAAALSVINPRGAVIGFKSNVAASQMDSYTTRSYEEIKRVQCYLFSWYLENDEAPEDQYEFEELVFSYFKGRFIPTIPRVRWEGTINLFRESILDAESAPEAAANVAVAAACSIPTS